MRFATKVKRMNTVKRLMAIPADCNGDEIVSIAEIVCARIEVGRGLGAKDGEGLCSDSVTVESDGADESLTVGFKLVVSDG